MHLSSETQRRHCSKLHEIGDLLLTDPREKGAQSQGKGKFSGTYTIYHWAEGVFHWLRLGLETKELLK